MKGPVTKVRQRPAESLAGLAGVIFVVGRSFGWSPDVTNAVAVVAAFIPSVVSFVVDQVKGSEG